MLERLSPCVMNAEPVGVTRYQKYDSVALPVAVTLSVVDCPFVIVLFGGCDVIAGGLQTVTVAAFEISEPQLLTTETK